MMWLAMPASRSLIALLIGTVAFFALWLVALKPSGSSSSKGSSSSQGLGQYQSDLNAAHKAVATSNASNAASGNDGTASSSTTSGGTAATTKSSASKTSTTKATSSKSAAKSKPVPHLTAKVGAHNHATLVRLSTVQKALSAHKMVVMLFYNPQGADDVAVRSGLSGLSTHRGRVVKVIIPLNEAANFTPVTQQVPVNFSPTLVLIAPSGQTDEIVGYSDPFEIAQRVDDGLASR
jgi:hypothetical protein